MTSEKEYEFIIKILIIGDSTVGKTNFVYKFSEDKFSENYFATTGIELKTSSIQIDGKSIKIQLWDTVGQEKYRAMIKNLYLKSQGIIILFDITNETSFINLKNWMSQIKESCGEDIPILLVGNKIDLEDNRVINKERAMEYANNENIEYIEVSSKTGENINKALTSLLQKILKRADSNSNFSFTLDAGTVKKKQSIIVVKLKIKLYFFGKKRGRKK